MEVNRIKKKYLYNTYRLTYDDYEYLIKKYGAVTTLTVLTFDVKDVLVQ